MARPKSELKSAFGRGQEILFALLEGVEDVGGTDNDARKIVTDKKLQRQIAQLLVSIKTLFAPVNYDDPAHRRIDREKYYNVADSLRSEHFPIRHSGQANVTYEYVTFDHDPTTQEVLDEVERRGDVELPDFANTRDFHNANPDERKKAPVISLCGAIVSRDGRRGVACVLADAGGLGRGWSWVGGRWSRCCRFLVVRKSR